MQVVVSRLTERTFAATTRQKPKQRRDAPHRDHLAGMQ
jgi:hypothetical protein